MAKVTPQEYAEKWGRRLKGSTEDIRRGVRRVDEAPGQAAARAVDLMKQKLLEAIEDGTWAARVAGVSLDEWRQAIETKGLQRLASGVDAAQPRQADMARELLAAVDEAAGIARRLPKGTIEDSINRMATFAREMNRRKLKRPR